MNQSSPPAENARALRADYRLAQGTYSRLDLLCVIARLLRQHGPCITFFEHALLRAMLFIGTENGAVLYSGQGVMTVLVSHGRALPAGSQLPGFGQAFNSQAEAGVRLACHSRLLLGARQEGMEILVPLTARGLPLHVLALVSDGPHAAPHANDLLALQTLACMLAPAIALLTRSAPAPVLPPAQTDLRCLTPREHQVFALLPRGMTNAAMAAQLGIAAGTVKVHVERIPGKLGVADRTRAAVLAARHGYGA